MPTENQDIESLNSKVFLLSASLAIDEIKREQNDYSIEGPVALPFDVQFANASVNYAQFRAESIRSHQAKVNSRTPNYQAKAALGIGFGFTLVTLSATALLAPPAAFAVSVYSLSGAGLIGIASGGIGALWDISSFLQEKQADEIGNAQAQSLTEGLKLIRTANNERYDQIVALSAAGQTREALSLFNQSLNTQFADNGLSYDADPTLSKVINQDRLAILEERFKDYAIIDTAVKAADDKSLNDLHISFKAIDKKIETWKATVEENQYRLDNLEEELSDVSDRVDTLSADVHFNTKDIEQNRQRIAYISSVVYGGMSSREKRQALKSGLFPSLKGAALAKELKAIERQELKENIERGINGLGDAAIIMDGLGVDPKLTALVSEIQVVAKTGMQAFDALSDGNYLRAAALVIGTFFKKRKPDAATLRHRQLMQRFADLEQNQVKIMDMISKVMEGIQALSKQVHSMHVDLANRININRIEVLANRAIIADIITKPVSNAAAFFDSRSDSPDFDYKEGKFYSYNGMRLHFMTYADLFYNGVMQLESILREPDLNSLFRLSTYSKNADESNDVLHLDRLCQAGLEIFANTCQHLRIHQETGLAAIAAMPTRIETLVSIWKTVHNPDPTEATSDRWEDIDYIANNIQEIIYLKAVLDVSQYIAQGHYYYQLFNAVGDHDLIAPDQLLKKRDVSLRGYKLLKKTIPILRSAQTQQLINNGAFMMSYIYEVLHKVKWLPDGGLDPDYRNQLKAKNRDKLEEIKLVLHFLYLSNIAQINFAAYLAHNLYQSTDKEPDLGPWGFDIFQRLTTSNRLFQEMNASRWPIISRKRAREINAGDEPASLPTDVLNDNDLIVALPIVTMTNGIRKLESKQIFVLEFPRGTPLAKRGIIYQDAVYQLVGVLHHIHSEIALYEVSMESKEKPEALKTLRVTAALNA